MTEGTSIDDMLTGSEPETEPTQPEVAQPAEQSDRPRDEHGRFAPKDEKGVTEEPQAEQPVEPEPQPEPPSGDDQLPKDVYEPLKAVRNENKELKQQLEAMRQQFTSQQRQQPQATEVDVDFWDNPQAFMAKQMEQYGRTMLQQFEQRQQVQRIEQSEAAAKAKYPDYGDAFAQFQQAVSVNPGLIQQMQAATDPGEFAYKTGKRALELEKVGSLDDIIRAERAKWEAEVRAKAPAPQFPSTTATDGSVGARTGPEWSGPKPIDDLLG